MNYPQSSTCGVRTTVINYDKGENPHWRPRLFSKENIRPLCLFQFSVLLQKSQAAEVSHIDHIWVVLELQLENTNHLLISFLRDESMYHLEDATSYLSIFKKKQLYVLHLSGNMTVFRQYVLELGGPILPYIWFQQSFNLWQAFDIQI